MSDKQLEVEEIIGVLKELGIRNPGVRFCLFDDGTGRIDQGASTKPLESWATIEELAEWLRTRKRESQRDRVVKAAVAYCKGGQTGIALHEAVIAFRKLKPKTDGT